MCAQCTASGRWGANTNYWHDSSIPSSATEKNTNVTSATKKNHRLPGKISSPLNFHLWHLGFNNKVANFFFSIIASVEEACWCRLPLWHRCTESMCNFNMDGIYNGRRRALCVDSLEYDMFSFYRNNHLFTKNNCIFFVKWSSDSSSGSVREPG